MQQIKSMEYNICTIEDRKIAYYIAGTWPDLLFLHGYGASPRCYQNLIQQLSQHYRVIAPEIFGINTTDVTPTTIKDCTELVMCMMQQLNIHPKYIVTHSMGGGVALELSTRIHFEHKLILMNPILPVNFSISGFMVRSFYKYARALTGITGGFSGVKYALSLVIPLIKSAIKAPNAQLKLIQDIARFQIGSYKYPEKIVVLYGMKDEYFNPKKYLPILGTFTNIKIHTFPNLSHDWPIFYQEKAAEEVLKNLT